MSEENRNTLAYSFREVHAKLASGRAGVRKQGPDGKWYTSYNPQEVIERKNELLDIVERLEGYE